MRLLKTHPILGLANSICLIVQILTGVFLAIHYSNTVDLAFIRILLYRRDIVQNNIGVVYLYKNGDKRCKLWLTYPISTC
ncbi:UNVERIFIED_CONTAM: bI1 [Trichonephila clavipes]